MPYKWGKDTARRPWWRLRPVESPDWHMLNSIATVRTTREHGKLRAHASFRYKGTGNRTEGYAILNSVPQARKWCERELAKFWEAPEIVG